MCIICLPCAKYPFRAYGYKPELKMSCSKVAYSLVEREDKYTNKYGHSWLFLYSDCDTINNSHWSAPGYIFKF